MTIFYIALGVVARATARNRQRFPELAEKE
jgi:hypothetical protein